MRNFFYFFLVLILIPKLSLSDNNLTSFDGDINSLNTNEWNNLTNERSSNTNNVTANFGNCNSIILRCVQPKCASGGCLSIDIVQPIVEACVMTNDACKNYGEALIKSISGQIVAKQTAKENERNTKNNQEAQQQANIQLQQMQNQMNQQMQTLQQEMANQKAESEQKIQQALAEQKAEFENQKKNYEQENNTQPLKSEEEIEKATEKGISADTLLREQASGQILSKIEAAETALKAVKKSMQNVFEYAKCDRNGNNCEGPKRITAFKTKTQPFFDSYDSTLDSLEDAINSSIVLGVNMTDISMMLNGGCNMWGKFVCMKNQYLRYASCDLNGEITETKKENDQDITKTRKKTLSDCYCYNYIGENTDKKLPCPHNLSENGQIIKNQTYGCRLIGNLSSRDNVQSEWLYSESNSETDTNVQIACVIDSNTSNMIIKRKRKRSNIDIETLQDIINESPNNLEQCYKNTTEADLEQWAKSRILPSKICIKTTELKLN